MILVNPQYPYEVNTKNPKQREFFKKMQLEIWSSGEFRDWVNSFYSTSEIREETLNLFPIPEDSDEQELIEFLAWVHKYHLPDDEGPFAFAFEIKPSWDEVFEGWLSSKFINTHTFKEYLKMCFPYGVIINHDKI